MPALKEINEKYDNDIPYDELIKFVESLDDELYNGFNPEMIDLVDDFFEKAS